VKTESAVLEFLQGEFDAPWDVWEGHTCPVGGPKSLKDWALYYAAKKLENGATVEYVKTIICEGGGSACEPGYEFSHGILYVGSRFGVKENNDPRRFVFADLVRELTEGPELPVQVSLFEVAA
jgi:hypothetical protein